MVQRRAMGQLGRILLSGSSGSQDERSAGSRRERQLRRADGRDRPNHRIRPRGDHKGLRRRDGHCGAPSGRVARKRAHGPASRRSTATGSMDPRQVRAEATGLGLRSLLRRVGPARSESSRVVEDGAAVQRSLLEAILAGGNEVGTTRGRVRHSGETSAPQHVAVGVHRGPSARHVEDGVRTLRALAQDSDRLRRGHDQEIDLPAVCLLLDLLHHRQRTNSTGGRRSKPLFGGTLTPVIARSEGLFELRRRGRTTTASTRTSIESRSV